MSVSEASQSKPDVPARPAASRWTPEYLHLWRNLLRGGALVFALCIVFSPVSHDEWQGVGILTLLSIIASLLLLPMPESGLTTSPTMPLVFAAAGLWGAEAAVLVTIGNSLATVLVIFTRYPHNRFRKTSQLIACGVVETGVSALFYVLLHRLCFPHGGVARGEHPTIWAWLALSLCTLMASLLNMLLTTTIVSRFMLKRWDIIWHENARWLLPSAVLMSPVAFVTGILYHQDWRLGVVFIIVPTWAARMAVVYHDRTIAAYKQGVELLGRIMQESHPYTHGHLHRVAHWAKKIAEELHLSAESMQFIEDAAVLHDIGKVAVDDRVLNKVGKLTDDDWAMIRRHPVVGAEIVGRIRYFNKVSLWIRHHHERPDGAGYPSSMAHEDIPIEACIISVVDAYDAMVGGPAKEDKRPYRNPMTPDAAIAELRKHAGTQFHNDVVEAFVTILEREQVLLASGQDADPEPEYDSLWDAPLKTRAAEGMAVRPPEAVGV